MSISVAQFNPYPLTVQALPMLHTLPAPVLQRHLSRGEVMRLGAGFCLPHTAEVPLARLYSLAPLLPHPQRVALCRSTAAWVWNALQGLPPCLEVNTLPPYSRVSTQLPDSTTPALHVVAHYSRYRPDDLVTYQGLTVTSRLRTLLDLLYHPGKDPHTTLLTCHRLRLSLGLKLPALTAVVTERRHPQKRTALHQLAVLAADEAATPEALANTTENQRAPTTAVKKLRDKVSHGIDAVNVIDTVNAPHRVQNPL